MQVDIIENGTVIDHIKAGMGGRVLELLGIDKDFENRVALVMWVPSKRREKKDSVKIEGKFLDEEKINVVSLVSPNATINLIKDGKVTEKRKVELPAKLENFGKCPNPNCITNHEYSKMLFTKEEEKYRCKYCERLFEPSELI